MHHAHASRSIHFQRISRQSKTETLLLEFLYIVSRMKIWKSKKVRMQKVELVQKALKPLENHGLWIAS
jgi:hypothetical protein